MRRTCKPALLGHVNNMIGKMLVAMIAVTALAAVPTADAVGIAGFIDVGSGGESMVACTGPGFIICGAAGAFSVGGCVDVPIKGNTCVGAGGVIMGGGSSLALDGGGGTGPTWIGSEVVPTQLTCNYSGASGGCAKTRGGSTGCKDGATAIGHGFINLPGVINTDVGESPVVSARAAPCGILLASSSAAALDIQNLLRQELTSQLDLKLTDVLADVSTIVPPELQGEFLAQGEVIKQQFRDYVNGIIIDEAYNVHYPADFTAEIVVQGLAESETISEELVAAPVEAPAFLFVGDVQQTLLQVPRQLI